MVKRETKGANTMDDKVAEIYTTKLDRWLISDEAKPIYNKNNSIIGYIKPFYNSWFEKLCYTWNSADKNPLSRYYHFESMDNNLNILNRIIQISSRKWTVILLPNQNNETRYILKDISTISRGSKLSLEFQGQNIDIENKRAKYSVQFIESNEGLFAQCDIKPESIQLTVQVFKPVLDIYLILTIGVIIYYYELRM